jgi:hypothetical protein
VALVRSVFGGYTVTREGVGLCAFFVRFRLAYSPKKSNAVTTGFTLGCSRYVTVC